MQAIKIAGCYHRGGNRSDSGCIYQPPAAVRKRSQQRPTSVYMSPSLTEVQGSTDKQLEESEGSPRGYVIGSYEEIPPHPTPPPQTPTPIPPFFFFCLPLRGLQWRREYQCLLKAKRMEVITAAEITVITVTASSSPRVSSCCRFQMRAEACVNICTSVCMWEKQPTAAG